MKKKNGRDDGNVMTGERTMKQMKIKENIMKRRNKVMENKNSKRKQIKK